MKASTLFLSAALTLCASGCGRPSTVGAPAGAAAGQASVTTIAANAALAQSLDLGDAQDFEDARRGLIARPSGKILAEDGSVLTDFDAFDFEQGAAPPTVNPSLWRHAQLNAQIGLFEVVAGIHQLRGFDIANITLIEGRSGWIVVDALTCRETAAAAMAFAREHLGNRPVTAIIFTHSHADHFGGALGVVSAEEVARRHIPVVAPSGFLEEATSENVLVGPAMARRSFYQFGKNLERSPRGLVDTGLGKAVGYGKIGILVPTQIISEPTQELELDGVRFVFHNAPGAEAPAEMTFTLPRMKAYGGAENLSQTMHNLLPIRGAKVRDALRWSQYMDQALDQAKDAEVYFGQHNWPVWGHDRIARLLTAHRDVYKYTHDQAVRLANAGLTPREIADRIKLPRSLEQQFGARGYYGDLRHNAKAVYQFYLGAYDGNPANLDPLPPQESARHYLALMGGEDKALAAAQADFARGEYRWTAELLNQVVLGAPGSKAARELLARTYEQLAYAAESSTWRNSYLVAAEELRSGPPSRGADRSNLVELLVQTPTERFLESIEASLDGPAAEGKDLKINLVLSDRKESYVLWIENAVLHHRSGPADPGAQATLTLTKSLFVKLLAGTAGLKETLLGDEIRVQGSRIELVRFFSLIDKAPGTFAIVTR